MLWTFTSSGQLCCHWGGLDRDTIAACTPALKSELRLMMWAVMRASIPMHAARVWPLPCRSARSVIFWDSGEVLHPYMPGQRLIQPHESWHRMTFQQMQPKEDELKLAAHKSSVIQSRHSWLFELS